MGKGGGGSSTTTVQKADPWSGMQPALRDLYAGTQNVLNNYSPQFFPGSPLAPFSPATQFAQYLTGQKALAGLGLPANMGQLLKAPVQPSMTAPTYTTPPVISNPAPAPVAPAPSPATANPLSRFRSRFLGGLGSFDEGGGSSSPFSSPAAPIAAPAAPAGPNASIPITYNGGYNGVGGVQPPGGSGTTQVQPLDFSSIHPQFQGPGINNANEIEVLKTLTGGYLNNNSNVFGTLNNVATGGMLNANPYLDAMYDRAAEAVNKNFSQNALPGIASMFSAGGRYGSNQMANSVGSATREYGDILNKLATDIYGGNYSRERVLQNQAMSQFGDMFGRERAMQLSMAGLAPGIANQEYADIGQLMGLGQTFDARNQALLGNEINKFDFYQNLPYQRLAQANSILNGGIGPLSGMSGSTTGPGGNPLMGALGGAMMGGQVLPMLGSAGMLGGLGGIGAGGGALSGPLAGAFGGMGLGPLGMIGGAILGGLFS